MPNRLTLKTLASRHEVSHKKESTGSSLSMHTVSFIMLLVLSSSLEIFSQKQNFHLQNKTGSRLSGFNVLPSFQDHKSTNASYKKYQSHLYTNDVSPKLTIPLPTRKIKNRSQRKKHKTTNINSDNKKLKGLFKKTFMSLVGSNDMLVSKYSESKVPTYMMDLYKQSEARHMWKNTNRRLNYGWFSGDTIRSFMADTQQKLESPQVGKRFLREKYIFRFNTSHMPENEKDKGSELRVFYTPPSYKPQANSQQTNRYFYNQDKIYVYLIDTTNNNQHILMDTKRIDRWTQQWVALNVSQVVEKFNDRRELIFKIILRSPKKYRHKRSSNPIKAVSDSLAINDASHTPLLVTYSESPNHDYSQQFHKKQRRKKKWTKHYNSPSHRQSVKRRQNKLCRRRKFYVGFEMLGWDDWIVAPNGYEAYFCQGYCPTFMPDYLNATNHATIQSLMHSRNPKQVPRPCCVPTKLEPLTLLYLAQRKGYIIKEYPNMVVLGCGCR